LERGDSSAVGRGRARKWKKFRVRMIGKMKERKEKKKERTKKNRFSTA
jgi:hypothetical protein